MENTLEICAEGRTTLCVNPGWLFSKDGEPFRKVSLPHDWAVDYPFTTEVRGNAGRLPYPGNGVYRKSFTLPAASAGKCVRLEIDGAMNHSSVWLNGREVSPTRPYGYISYAVDLTPALNPPGTPNELEVRLATPPRSTRYYSGAGLFRDVRLVVLDPLHIAYCGLCARTAIGADGNATLNAALELQNPGGAAVKTHAVLSRGGAVVAEGWGDGASASLAVASPLLWSPETPELYGLAVEIVADGAVRDRVETRVGFRTLDFRPGEGFFLNGRHRQMKGACLHHDFGALGGAFHVDAARRQLGIMKEMGADAIRTTHNPPDPKFLDLCDEMGLMVMDEAFDVWELPKTENDYHVEFPEWHERDLADFVKRDRNHPCVVMWSIGNEVEEHTRDPGRGVRIGKRLVEIVHRYDDRPTTCACWSPQALVNGMQEICEAMGCNYLPWYYGGFMKDNPGKGVVGTETESVLSSRGVYFFPWPEKPNNLYKDDPQPFFYGKAGDENGVWGVRPEVYGRIFRDEQVTGYDVACYQADLNHPPDTQFKYQDMYPAVYGMFTWTGVDYLGEPTPYGDDGFKARSAYFGACDLCGFPKDRFHLFRAHWLPDVPSAHILPHWNWKRGDVIPVHVYASGDEAELFVNGKSQGVRRRGEYEYRFRWDAVAYEPGEVSVAVRKDGKPWAADAVKTAGAPARVEREVDFEGDALVFYRYKAVDKDGNFCPTAALDIDLSAFGDALIGVCNGNPADWTPFKASHITTFNGLAQAIVRKE